MNTMTTMLVAALMGCGISIAVAAAVSSTVADKKPAPISSPFIGHSE